MNAAAHLDAGLETVSQPGEIGALAGEPSQHSEAQLLAAYVECLSRQSEKTCHEMLRSRLQEADISLDFLSAPEQARWSSLS
eukprot:3812273-Amphidinium_carterae.1